jgi:hypothetical protein
MKEIKNVMDVRDMAAHTTLVMNVGAVDMLNT